MNRVQQLVQYLRDVRAEGGRVQWAEPRQTLTATGVVVVFVAITAVYLGAVDFLVSKMLDWMLR